MPGTLASIEAERARLVQQMATIETAQHEGAATILFGGTTYTIEAAMQLTRAALYEAEMERAALVGQ